MDFTTPDGVKGELQIMTHQEKATSLINHSLRSQFGENPPEPIEKVQQFIGRTFPDRFFRWLGSFIKRLFSQKKKSEE